MVKSQKGGAFEREMSRVLSNWWTGNVRDDMFWRSAGSGAMAKTRSKVGKSTYGQYGDVHACHPFGKPLLDVFTIELKRGYNAATPMDLFDTKLRDDKKKKIEEFIEQVQEDQTNAGTPFWLLIHKRDRKQPMAYFPIEVFTATTMLQGAQRPHMYVFQPDRNLLVIGTQLSHFLEWASPDEIQDYARKIKNDKENNDKELSAP